MSPEPNLLEELQRERLIRQKLLQYCRGIDRCDAELVASVYHPDGTDDHGSFKGLGRDFATYAAEHLKAGCDATLHALGDSLFNFVSPHMAIVETYVQAFHRRHDDDGIFLEKFGGRYVDRFEERSGEWRIAHRVCIHEWDAKERVELAFRPGRFVEGVRDRSDLAYGDGSD